MSDQPKLMDGGNWAEHEYFLVGNEAVLILIGLVTVLRGGLSYLAS